MPGNYKKQQENLTFDALLQTVSAEFAAIDDHRRVNAKYALSDILMLLAFTVDQLLQRCWQPFRQVRAGLRTKAKLWESLRALFRVQCFRTMEALYARMAELYNIQLC